ncbi:DUF2182 domain-containing protein [Allosphingosinicella humi]
MLIWRGSTFPPTVPPEARIGAGPAPRERWPGPRERWIVGAALLGAAGLAWAWLLSQPAGGSAMAGMTGTGMGGAGPWSADYLLPAFAMWALMMVAMMLPSAMPMILLYARVSTRTEPRGAYMRTGLFALAYLALWAGFALAAAALQALLVARGTVSDMALALGDGRLAGGLLVAAGLYELTPVKHACLENCRSPLSFVMRLWRPGTAGALRLGLAHGAYCIGCCWALMLLLFVGGVMNLAWIGGLALLILVEKLAPARLPVTQAAAGALILGGGVLLVRG